MLNYLGIFQKEQKPKTDEYSLSHISTLYNNFFFEKNTKRSSFERLRELYNA